MSDVKLGVFICNCGGQISSVLDTDCLAGCAGALPGVAVAQRLDYSCSPDGLETILAVSAEQGLTRVLVAGCTPRMQEHHFQAACLKANLARDLVEWVDLREGCAWPHANEPGQATAKALDLLRMGVARAAWRQPRQLIHGEVLPGVVVIGGGIAGMTAALTIANAGHPVRLVEREAALGGMLRDVQPLLIGRRTGKGLSEKIDEVLNHPHIDVFLASQVTAVSGTVGRYSLTINDHGTPVEAGAIVVATGARPWQPWGVSHYRYDGKRVVTQDEFEHELRAGVSEASVAMILCAEQRTAATPTCSGVCCLGALRQAMALKGIDPQAAVTILYRDLYLLGDKANEKLVAAARQAGVAFLRYTPAAPPQVVETGVDVVDAITGKACHVPCDRVVLATPLVPQSDAGVVAHLLGIRQDEHGFFPEVRDRLRPEAYAERGIYVCGAAHHPAEPAVAELEAVTAALRAARHVQAGQLASGAPVARVDETLCTGCAHCVAPCPFNAIAMHTRGEAVDLAQIDPLLCTGCGNCVVVCPVKAISQPVDGDAEILAQIEAALAAPSEGRPRILVFGCEWSGHAAAELAGATRLIYPVETRLIRTRCSARFDPIHVLWALLHGADGVFLGACPAGDCHYVDGNRYAQERISVLRDLLAKNGFDPRRVRMDWIVPDDPHEFVKKISGFTDLVSKL